MERTMTQPDTSTSPTAGSTRRLPARLERIGSALEKRVRGLAVANLLGQGVLIVTGGAVRLTESGLGCSTAPQCEPGEFVPAWTPETSSHVYIEFGNRLLATLLLLIAAAAFIAVWRARPHLRLLGALPVAGVLIQAVLGAIVVRQDLNPWLVAPHLLISVALVWLSVLLALKVRDAPPRAGVASLHFERLVSTVLLFVVVVLGALTTGAGPHSGDSEATERLALNPASVARVHALSVWAFVALVAWIAWRVRRDRSLGDRDEVRRASVVLLVVTLVQGLIGYVQYFTGLPIVLVGAHLAGAAVLVAAHSAAWTLLRPAAVSETAAAT